MILLLEWNLISSKLYFTKDIYCIGRNSLIKLLNISLRPLKLNLSILMLTFIEVLGSYIRVNMILLKRILINWLKKNIEKIWLIFINLLLSICKKILKNQKNTLKMLYKIKRIRKNMKHSDKPEVKYVVKSNTLLKENEN